MNIIWSGHGLAGTPSWEYLPDTLISLDLGPFCEMVRILNNLDGRVPFRSLPSKLEDLALRENMFSGSVELCFLPKQLRCMDLGFNNFEGEVIFTHLPSSMTVLDVEGNVQLRGRLDGMSHKCTIRFLQTLISKA